jgi:hypothetical protein
MKIRILLEVHKSTHFIKAEISLPLESNSNQPPLALLVMSELYQCTSLHTVSWFFPPPNILVIVNMKM